MSKDKRAEIVETLLYAWRSEVVDCTDPECEECNRAASAALDAALKAIAEITDAEIAFLIRDAKTAFLIRDAKIDVEAGDAARYKANTAAWWSVRLVRSAIHALTSEGVKE